MKYQYIGPVRMTFPSILNPNGSGTLVCETGDIVELDDDPNHADLVAFTGKPPLAKTTKPKGVGDHVADEQATLDDEPKE